MEVVETSKNLPPLLLAYDSWIPSENTQIEKKIDPVFMSTEILCELLAKFQFDYAAI